MKTGIAMNVLIDKVVIYPSVTTWSVENPMSSDIL